MIFIVVIKEYFESQKEECQWTLEYMFMCRFTLVLCQQIHCIDIDEYPIPMLVTDSSLKLNVKLDIDTYLNRLLLKSLMLSKIECMNHD
jgi:hypothetical protein